MDELIFQEFKGTGNMELILDRKLSDRRLFPAIDIPKSGTRKEEKLFPAKYLEAIRKLRRTMVDLNPIEAMETLTARSRNTRPTTSCSRGSKKAVEPERGRAFGTGMFGFLKKRRRDSIRSRPFPSEWRDILVRRYSCIPASTGGSPGIGGTHSRFPGGEKVRGL